MLGSKVTVFGRRIVDEGLCNRLMLLGDSSAPKHEKIIGLKQTGRVLRFIEALRNIYTLPTTYIYYNLKKC